MKAESLITSFFRDVEEYKLFMTQFETGRMNKEGTCLAKLVNLGSYYKYTIHWLEDGKFFGDYVKRFDATEENLQKFNEGCRNAAEKFAIYLETGDPEQVPELPLSFGDLTAVGV